MMKQEAIALSLGPGPSNSISDITGISIAHAQDMSQKTGVTVIVCNKPAVAGLSILGGAPGTRDTQLLGQGNSVEKIDAVVLSGGSAFGLDAAGGAMAALSERGRGFNAAGHHVPIVPSAILFDLAAGGEPSQEKFHPHRDLAYQATMSALEKPSPSPVKQGSVGAGTGALAGWLKGGIGTASAKTKDGLIVAAIIAVNSVGQTTMGKTPCFWAYPFEENNEFGGLAAPANDDAAKSIRMKFRDQTGARQNTTIGVIATNADLTASQCDRLAISGQDGLARAIWPCHTPFDGDCIFSIATADCKFGLDDFAFFDLCALASAVSARAVAKAVYHASSLPNDPYPCWQDKFGNEL